MQRLALLLVVAACSREPPKPTAPLEPPKAAPLALGQPVTAAPVALSDVAKNPRAFEGRTLSTSGTVTAVCQNRGCWLELRDESGLAHVRMHGHSFFVPRSASGRHARVEATVVPMDDAKECDESPAPGGSALAKVDLDATGVELD